MMFCELGLPPFPVNGCHTDKLAHSFISQFYPDHSYWFWECDDDDDEEEEDTAANSQNVMHKYITQWTVPNISIIPPSEFSLALVLWMYSVETAVEW